MCSLLVPLDAASWRKGRARAKSMEIAGFQESAGPMAGKNSMTTV